MQHPRRRVRRRVNEGSRQGCQRLDRSSAPWEDNAHARVPAGRHEHGVSVERPIRRSGLGRRETSGPPEASRGAKDSTGSSPARESGESEPGNARGAGARKIVWVAEVGRTHRVSSSSGGRKPSRRSTKALAGKKSVAPPDAGRGWAEGETVCALADTMTSCPWAQVPSGSGSLGSSIRRKAFSGSRPLGPHRQGDARPSGSRVNPHQHGRSRGRAAMTEERIGRRRTPTRACPRVT